MTIKRRWLILGIVFLLAILIWHFIAVQYVPFVTAGRAAAADYRRENSLLSDLPRQLGLSTPSTSTICNLSERKYTFDSVVCFHGPDFNFHNKVNKSSYSANRTAILENLAKNDWRADNPTELENSPDKLLDVAYHKNTPGGSCNLKLSSFDNTFYVNLYNCRRTVHLPDINLKTSVYGP